MEDTLKYPQINFQILGKHEQSLQVLLMPNQAILTHLPNIVYMSKNLKLTYCYKTLLAKFRALFNSKPPLFRFKVTNKGEGVGYVGLGKPLSGKILALNPSVLQSSIIMRDQSILAISSNLNITRFSRDEITILQRSKWYEVSGNGLAFMTVSGTIVEKRLGEGEEIQVAYNALVAYSKEVTVESLIGNRDFSELVFYDWCLLKVRGPGIVFIDGAGLSMTEKARRVGRSDTVNLMICLLGIILLTILQKVLV